MTDYKMPREVAHQIAVGLYQQVSEFVAVAKQNNPEDYERFKAEYQDRQVVQSSTPVKCRQSRNRPAISRQNPERVKI